MKEDYSKLSKEQINNAFMSACIRQDADKGKELLTAPGIREKIEESF